MKNLLPFILCFLFPAVQPTAMAAANISKAEDILPLSFHIHKRAQEKGVLRVKLTSVFPKKKTDKPNRIRFKETNSRYGSIAIILLVLGIILGLTLSWWLLAILGSASLFFAFSGARYDRKKKWSTTVFVLVGLAAFLILLWLVVILIVCWGPGQCN